MMSGRILAVDYGQKRIGLAISDPLRFFANPLKTISNHGNDIVADMIAAVVHEQAVSLVIVGIPYSTEGNITAKTQEALDFMAFLADKLSVPVSGWDERYTTAEAIELLQSKKMDWKKSRPVIDAIAASLILKSYLEQNSQT